MNNIYHTVCGTQIDRSKCGTITLVDLRMVWLQERAAADDAAKKNTIQFSCSLIIPNQWNDDHSAK